MKSTRVFKILSIALAAAVVFYFLVQGVRYLTNPYATTRVYTSTTEDAVEASGWLVREEETFRTDAGTLSPTREEGEKVGQGQVIAATYDSPGALEAVAQIQAKRLQLEQLEYALSSYLNPDAALKLDGSISDDIMALRKNLTGGDYTAASGDLSQLKAAIVKRSRAYTSSQEIKAEITAVQDEINATVVETVTDAVTTVSSVCKALGLDADDVSQGIIEKLGSAQQSLLALENTLTAMQTLVDQTDSILACAGVVSDDLNNIVKSGDLSGVQDALNRGVGRLNEAEAEIARQLEDIDNQLDVIAADLAAAMGTAEGPAQLMDQRLEALQQRLEKLRDYADNYPAIQERLGNAIYHIGELRDLLKKLEDPSQLESWNQEVQAKLDQVRQDLREAALRISESVNQRVEELNRDVQEKLQAVQNVFDNVSGGLTALGDKLGRYQDAIRSTDTTLGGAIQLSATLRGDLGKLSDDVERIVTSDGFRRFLDVLENNPEELAGYLSDPIAMETVPVYEITTYGSAMAPYYIMLALFVGSLLTATMIHVNAPIPPLPLLRPWQRFFGRYQLFFLVGMVQALVTGLGCVYYIGMQCLHPGLFLLACCVCSLNFTMMNFALVYALDNIGMALSVIIMVIQVAGSGGSYPIDVLPEVFQKLYVLMPFHYGMDMLRETIAGRYENVYWTNLAVMAGMCVLFAALGMLLYYPARPLNRLIARSKEKSGIM